MPEFVSQAVRERKEKPFYQKALAYLFDPVKYGYEVVAEIFRPGKHYFDDGVVAFTDAERTIDMLPDESMPYGGITATKLHELDHIRRRKKSMPQDETQINRDVTYAMGLIRFPFPSYA